MIHNLIGIREHITFRSQPTAATIGEGVAEGVVVLGVIKHHVLWISTGILVACSGTVLPGKVPLDLDIAGFSKLAGINLVHGEIRERIHAFFLIGLGGLVQVVVNTHPGGFFGLKEEFYRTERLDVLSSLRLGHFGSDGLGDGLGATILVSVLDVHGFRPCRNRNLGIAEVSGRNGALKHVFNGLRAILMSAFLFAGDRKSGSSHNGEQKQKLFHKIY